MEGDANVNSKCCSTLVCSSMYDAMCRVHQLEVVSTGGAPTPAGTSVFTKHNWDMGMGYLWLNGWGIYHLMGGAFMAYWVGHL